MEISNFQHGFSNFRKIKKNNKSFPKMENGNFSKVTFFHSYACFAENFMILVPLFLLYNLNGKNQTSLEHADNFS